MLLYLTYGMLFSSVLVEILADVSTRYPKMERDSNEYRLFQYLFANYSNEVRPVIRQKDAVNVSFEIAPRQIVDLDEKNQILTSNVWIRQYWTNPWLMWNDSDFGKISSINVSPEIAWRPDIVLYNNADGVNGGEMYEFKTKVVMKSNGSCEWFAPTLIKTQCKIEIEYFPFDDQYCEYKFGSWTFTGDMLNLSLTQRTTADLSKYTMNGEWQLMSATVKRNVITYTCCPEPYIDLTYTIHLRRRVLFYLNNLIIPAVLLACLTVFSFQLPPESGERISLNINALLGMTFFMLIFTDNIPPSSEATPLLGKYFSMVVLEMSMSLICTCVSLKIYHQNPETEVPHWLRVLIFKVLAPVFRMAEPERRVRSQQRTYIIEESALKSCSLVYQVRATPREPDVLERAQSFLRDDVVEKLISRVDGLCQRLDSKDEVSEKREEWHFITLVIDKLFFWLFSVTVTISTYVFATLAFSHYE